MSQKPIKVVLRLHEQREHPEKQLKLVLKKGVLVEELNWDPKTEKTTIFRRLVLKSFKWRQHGKKRRLSLVLAKQDMVKEKGKKQKLVARIVEGQYPVLAHSFFDHMISSTVHKLEGIPPKDAERLAKAFADTMVKNSKKEHVVEKGV